MTTTRVPHSAEKREDGSENYGFVDLRNRPELVDEIREAKKSEGLAAILRVANSCRSMLMTFGCDCCLLEKPTRGPLCVGSFVDITYRDHLLNNDSKNLIALARLIQGDIRRVDESAIWYRMTVMPLFEFFGLPDRYELLLKVFGRGNSPRKAWNAFDRGTTEVAGAIQRLM